MPMFTMLCHAVALTAWAALMVSTITKGGWFLALAFLAWLAFAAHCAVTAGRLIAARDNHLPR